MIALSLSQILTGAVFLFVLGWVLWSVYGEPERVEPTEPDELDGLFEDWPERGGR